MRRAFAASLVVALFSIAACGTTGGSSAGPLPEIDGPGIRSLIAEADQPLVINVWASWCGPCRSEAPLLTAAHDQFGEQVRFVGIDTQDSQADAAAFIDEFGLGGFEHWFDQSGAVRSELGGFGVPVTYFVDAAGNVTVHAGIIDERALVLGIDEIMAP